MIISSLKLKIQILLNLIVLLLVSVQCHANDEFLNFHWKIPLPNPVNKANLDSSNCMNCHKSQYSAFQNSLHSKTMDSGVLWQLQDMDEKERLNCYSCHSPFSIQQEQWNHYLNKDFNDRSNYKKKHKHESPQSLAKIINGIEYNGITCATCHIRGDRFYGPALSGKLTQDNSGVNSHLLEIRDEFSDEKFCINCHITPTNGKKINGKYLMDIYEDWKSTPFAIKGSNYKTCQSCHMPNREHSWKGIHDKDFVASSVNISYDKIKRELEIFNHGVGHRFPAYSVPRIEILLVDKSGKPLSNKKLGNTIFHKELGWKLDIYLEKEWEDSRILAGEKRTIQIPDTIEHGNKLQIFIHPRFHYGVSFRYSLRNLQLNPWEISEIERAIRLVDESRYLLWERNF